MKKEKVIASLRQMEQLVGDCLTALGARPEKAKKTATKMGRQSSRNALPDHVLRIRDEGYFRQPRTAREVHEKLGATYPCEIDRVSMALLRLNDRKKLRKASKVVDKKKQVAYVR